MMYGKLYLDLMEKSVVTSKWVYKIKHAVDGSIDRYKARFVGRGFSQQEGEDCDETFAPDARYTSILLKHPWVGVYIRWM
jgi:hypothetical protein